MRDRSDKKTPDLFCALPVRFAKRGECGAPVSITQRLVHALAELGEGTVSEVAQKAGVSRAAASKRMPELAKRRIIREAVRKDAGRARVWKLW